MSIEQAINNFLHVCCSVYNFVRKPTVAVHYNGEKLKRFLEQRWTRHLATVTVVLICFQHTTTLFKKMATSRAHKAETCIEASSLL